MQTIEKLGKILTNLIWLLFEFNYLYLMSKKGHNIPEIRLRALRSIKSKLSQYISGNTTEAFRNITSIIGSLINWFTFKPLTEEDQVLNILESIFNVSIHIYLNIQYDIKENKII